MTTYYVDKKKGALDSIVIARKEAYRKCSIGNPIRIYMSKSKETPHFIGAVSTMLNNGKKIWSCEKGDFYLYSNGRIGEKVQGPFRL